MGMEQVMIVMQIFQRLPRIITRRKKRLEALSNELCYQKESPRVEIILLSEENLLMATAKAVQTKI